MVLTFALAFALGADGGAPAPARGCTLPEHRQFDFWLGHWLVRTTQGAIAGNNTIEAALGGCALVENWQGAKGGRGTSLNSYDAERKVWRQTWVDDQGTVLVLEGGLVNGAMTLTSAPNKGRIDRITWMKLPDGSVRQLWESSSAPKPGVTERTWAVQFDGQYVKASPPRETQPPKR